MFTEEIARAQYFGMSLPFGEGTIGPTEKRKTFIIGLNKSGTSSIMGVACELGLIPASQLLTEVLLLEWLDGDFQRLKDIAKQYDIFKDVPFSLAFAFRQLDKEFPDSRFILTTRGSEDIWFRSIVRYHSVAFGDGVNPLTRAQVENTTYRFPKYLEVVMTQGLGVDINDPYNEERLKKVYNQHTLEARRHFDGRHNDFLEVNVEDNDPTGYHKICRFLGRAPVPERVKIPKLNTIQDLIDRRKTHESISSNSNMEQSRATEDTVDPLCT